MLVYLLKLCFVASLALAGFATAEQVSNKLGGSGDPDDAPTPSKLRTLQPPPQLLPHHPIPGIPPGFEKVLPEQWLDELRKLHNDTTLSFPEKRQKFEEIMASVPSEVLQKLPLAPIFDQLPEDWKQKVRGIYANVSIPWSDKHQKIGELMASMPPEIRSLLPQHPPFVAPPRPPNNGFPMAPPPGFEKVIPKANYTELLKIHQDPKMSVKEKAERIDKIMRSLDQTIIDKLPLPPGFDRLPEDKVKEARAIFADKSLDYQAKDKKVAEFVEELSPNQRKLLRPDLPSPLNDLPQDVKDQIQEIFDDQKMDTKTRHQKFWKLIKSLPAEQKILVQDSFAKPIAPPMLVPPPSAAQIPQL